MARVVRGPWGRTLRRPGWQPGRCSSGRASQAWATRWGVRPLGCAACRPPGTGCPASAGDHEVASVPAAVVCQDLNLCGDVASSSGKRKSAPSELGFQDHDRVVALTLASAVNPKALSSLGEPPGGRCLCTLVLTRALLSRKPRTPLQSLSHPSGLAQRPRQGPAQGDCVGWVGQLGPAPACSTGRRHA